MTYAARYQQKSKALNVLGMAGVALTLGLAGCSNNEQADTTANADGAATDSQNIELLNVSYDVARDFIKTTTRYLLSIIKQKIQMLTSTSISHMVVQVSKRCL